MPDPWKGKFGDDYNKRNENPNFLKNNKALFEKMDIGLIRNALEFGCGYGYALLGLKSLFPNIHLTGVDINEKAIAVAKSKGIEAIESPMFEFDIQKQYDFVLTKGMLVCVTEEDIDKAYKLLYDSSCKYICICEYYNPSLVIIDHRGNSLYKRDYGKIMDLYPDLKLVNYGFVYHRDEFPQDDCTWFLFEKQDS